MKDFSSLYQQPNFLTLYRGIAVLILKAIELSFSTEGSLSNTYIELMHIERNTNPL